MKLINLFVVTFLSTSFQLLANDLVHFSNDLSFELIKTIKKKSSDNIFISPYSIHNALLMCSFGADGNTKTQLQKVLFPNFDLAANSSMIREYSFSPLSVQGVTLKVANSLWVERTYELKKEYLRDVISLFNADAFPVNFIEDFKGARGKINRWVFDKSEEKIKDLLPEDSLSSLTRLVLANAVYFKGEWSEEFDVKSTSIQTFLGKNKKSKVPFMHALKKYYYFKDKNFEMLRLFFKREQVSLNIFLPKHKREKKFFKSFSLKEYNKAISEAKSDKKVALSFPKFKLESSIKLKKILIALGITDAFNEVKANFSAITSKNNLFIDNVYHKAFFEIDEKGAEASAATGAVMMQKTVSLDRPIEFKVNRPFYFTITNNSDQAIYFSGWIRNL